MNCTSDDTGEIFVQINFEGQVPLTNSIFQTIYQVPKWHNTPDLTLTGHPGEDLTFSLQVDEIKGAPPLNEVVVQFVSQQPRVQGDYQDKSMVITSSRISGVHIKCEPFSFHRDLRYTGDVDLYQLKFMLPEMDKYKAGNYTISVVYEMVHYNLTHNLEITLSEWTVEAPMTDINPTASVTQHHNRHMEVYTGTVHRTGIIKIVLYCVLGILGCAIISYACTIGRFHIAET